MNGIITKYNDFYGNPIDIANEVSRGPIYQILAMVSQAYGYLLSDNIVNVSTKEIVISSYLFKHINEIWKTIQDCSYTPITEYPDDDEIKKGTPCRIDFCFVEWDYSILFRIECKLLEEKTIYISQYIDNGINRYLSGKYGKDAIFGGMLGYIRNGNKVVIIDTITDKTNNIPGIIEKMKISDKIGDIDDHYTSIHSRISPLSPILIHHLFLVF